MRSKTSNDLLFWGGHLTINDNVYTIDTKLRFEWDDSKEWANRMKHGLRFETVIGLWEDQHATEFIDENSIEETRYIRRGFNEQNQFVIVVFTERNDVIRIISARLGTLRERRLHEGRI